MTSRNFNMLTYIEIKSLVQLTVFHPSGYKFAFFSSPPLILITTFPNPSPFFSISKPSSAFSSPSRTVATVGMMRCSAINAVAEIKSACEPIVEPANSEPKINGGIIEWGDITNRSGAGCGVLLAWSRLFASPPSCIGLNKYGLFYLVQGDMNPNESNLHSIADDPSTAFKYFSDLRHELIASSRVNDNIDLGI